MEDLEDYTFSLAGPQPEERQPTTVETVVQCVQTIVNLQVWPPKASCEHEEDAISQSIDDCITILDEEFSREVVTSIIRRAIDADAMRDLLADILHATSQDGPTCLSGELHGRANELLHRHRS